MPYSSDCSFVFQIFCKNRDKLLKRFKEKNWCKHSLRNPLPSMTYYKNKYNLNMLNFQKAKKYAISNISLPVYPSLTSKEQNKVINVIKEFYGY